MALIDNRLTTFLAVAREDSFSKAAKALYLSSVSVMKQIDSLESEVGALLCERSPRGIKLTDAGRVLREDALRMTEAADAALEHIVSVNTANANTIRVGTSLLRPCKPLMDLIARREGNLPYRIEVIAFSDDEESLKRTFRFLGKEIDCIVGPVGSREFVERHNVLVLGTWECCIAVARSHPLACKDRLTWDDLDGLKLMLVRKGDSFVLDRMRKEIALSHPNIEIVDAPYFYDANIFNECERQGVVMETLDVWNDVHPGVVTLPIDWGYRMPYGIVYAKKPSDAMTSFIEAISQDNSKAL